MCIVVGVKTRWSDDGAKGGREFETVETKKSRRQSRKEHAALMIKLRRIGRQRWVPVAKATCLNELAAGDRKTMWLLTGHCLNAALRTKRGYTYNVNTHSIVDNWKVVYQNLKAIFLEQRGRQEDDVVVNRSLFERNAREEASIHIMSIQLEIVESSIYQNLKAVFLEQRGWAIHAY